MNKNQKQNCKGLCVCGPFNFKDAKTGQLQGFYSPDKSKFQEFPKTYPPFSRLDLSNKNIKNLSVWGLKKAFKFK